MWKFFKPRLRNIFTTQIRISSEQLGETSRGAGKGGSGDGSGAAGVAVGGAFRKRRAAEEELYFRNKEQEHITALKQRHQEKIDQHQTEIERLQEELSRH